MEESGCPPFWKKRFPTFANFREFVSHAIDFIKSRKPIQMIGRAINMIKSGQANETLRTRKEHVPESIKKEFKETMEILYPKNAPLKKIYQEEEKQKLYKNGEEIKY